ncbi:hypothetical protein [Agaribacterium sp. ZY112]|uniref:hypothetical protein n=1 Tax=Agaribacterium sp. ZY112 TaxID=3233574 RepID=UPI0035261BC5
MTRTSTPLSSSTTQQEKLVKPIPITWFVVTAIGQWLFVLYILAYYGLRFGSLSIAGFKGTHLANGFIEGDALGNIALAIHILVASMIIAVGQIQLTPIIRQ